MKKIKKEKEIKKFLEYGWRPKTIGAYLNVQTKQVYKIQKRYNLQQDDKYNELFY